MVAAFVSTQAKTEICFLHKLNDFLKLGKKATSTYKCSAHFCMDDFQFIPSAAKSRVIFFQVSSHKYTESQS